MKISGRTKVVGIFGDPVEQTLSTYMHNAAFEALGLEFVYTPFHVKKENLKHAVSAIRALDMPGINITIPHKKNVIEFLDTVDKEALSIGAVNTIVNKGGVLTGYNTDGAGYWQSLSHETGFKPEGKTIAILGAGGAARAIAFTLLNKNPKMMIIANRTIEKGESLADEFKKKKSGVEILATSLNLTQYMEEIDLLINTTSVGMMGKVSGTHDQNKLNVPLERLSKDAIVSDIVYRPLATPLIKDAKEKGLKAHMGLGMLIHQGALSFTLWTGRPAPIDTMRFAAIQALEVR